MAVSVAVVTWNVLSYDLLQPQRDANCARGSFYPDLSILKETKRFDQWVRFVREGIREQKIMAFQELPKSWFETFVTESQGEKHYGHLSSFYGPPPAEMGVALIIPTGSFEIHHPVSFLLQDIAECAPEWEGEQQQLYRRKRGEVLLGTTVVHRSSGQSFFVCTTHFPCWFYLPRLMSQILQGVLRSIDALLESSALSRFLLVGDLNMTPPAVQAALNAYDDRSKISSFFPSDDQRCTTMTVANRDPDQPYNKNSFVGCLDHAIYTCEEDSHLSLHSLLPTVPNPQEWIKQMQFPPLPQDAYPDVIPNAHCISDHYPVEWRWNLGATKSPIAEN